MLNFERNSIDLLKQKNAENLKLHQQKIDATLAAKKELALINAHKVKQRQKDKIELANVSQLSFFYCELTYILTIRNS